MTLAELRHIVEVLSNSCFVRYWIHWNYPARAPHLMALCAIREDGSTANLYEVEMTGRGFTKETHDRLDYWTIERVDEEGNPWRSTL